MRWTLKYLEQLEAEGKIRGFIVRQEIEAPQKSKRKRKYNNNKVEWNGMLFDSTKEYTRYRTLLLLLKKGEIGQLQRQVKYAIYYEGELICTYIADHVYINAVTGERFVEDVKSDATRKLSTYRLKKRMMKKILNIDIKEV